MECLLAAGTAAGRRHGRGRLTREVVVIVVRACADVVETAQYVAGDGVGGSCLNGITWW